MSSPQPPVGAEVADQIEPLHRFFAREVNDWVLGVIDLSPGDSVLELAAGTGDFSVRLAPRVRPGGMVLCTDVRPESVRAAHEKALAEGVREIQARVADMRATALPDESFDAVVCRWGLMFAGPMGVALNEMRRVLRPGGRLALAIWADPDRNPWTTLVDGAIRDVGFEPPDRRAPGEMLCLADPASLTVLLQQAGFSAIATALIPVRWFYPNADAYWYVDVRWPGGPLARCCGESHCGGLRARPPGRCARVALSVGARRRPTTVPERAARRT